VTVRFRRTFQRAELFLRVAMLAVGCLLSVSIAVITISVIQFQVRLHEARTQSRDFALATVIQMAEFEKSIEDTIKIVTDLGPGALHSTD
jgi:hypothetical protein